MQSPLALIDSAGPASALLEPARLRILEELRDPGSAAEVARKLGLPRQRVGYHVRELERQGLLEYVGDRKKRNCTERLVQATARHYLIAPQVLGSLGADPARIRDRLSSTYLVAVAADTIRVVAAMREGAERAGKQFPTLTVRADVTVASAAAQHAFAEDLATAVAQVIRRHHDAAVPGGRTFRLSVLGHPAPPTPLPQEPGDPDAQTGPVPGPRGGGRRDPSRPAAESGRAEAGHGGDDGGSAWAGA